MQRQFDNFNVAGAYAAGLVLAILALIVLFSMNMLQRWSARAVDVEDDDEGAPPATTVFVPQPTEKEA